MAGKVIGADERFNELGEFGRIVVTAATVLDLVNRGHGRREIVGRALFRDG